MPKHHHYQGGEAARDFNTQALPYHVMIATPTSRGLCVPYVMGIVATIETLIRFGVKTDFHLLADDCHVDDARNKIFREFLTTPCTDLLFIDSDMGWRPQDVLRLLSAPGDIVAGIYRHKNEVETYPFHPGSNTGPRTANEHGLFEMPKVPTGFMRIRREVIEALHKWEVDKGRVFWDSPEDEATGKIPIAAICERAFASEMKLSIEVGDHSNRHSGDLVLCLKARHLGFKCFADLEMQFDHVGEQAWTGNLGNFLRRQQGLQNPGFCEAVDMIRAGKTGPSTFRKLFEAFGVTEWPMMPEGLHELFHEVKNGSGDVLETGSGLSTLVISLALEGTSRKLHALEHDVLYWQQTGQWLQRYDLTSNVVLHLAPLMPQGGCIWYDIGPRDLPEHFGVALIDGPPHKYGRDGVFHILGDALASATMILDDAARERFEIDTHDIEMRVCNRTYAVARPKLARAA
jgi:hypothetical protein